MTKQPQWMESFDTKFGKDGPEKNSDSIGEHAGCDDCEKNIEIRAEHKQFIIDKDKKLRDRIAEMSGNADTEYGRGRAQAIQMVLELLDK